MYKELMDELIFQRNIDLMDVLHLCVLATMDTNTMSNYSSIIIQKERFLRLSTGPLDVRILELLSGFYQERNTRQHLSLLLLAFRS